MGKNGAGKGGDEKSTREKAAAARAAQQAAEKRRERTIRIIGAIAVVAVVVVIIGLAVIVPRLSGDTSGGGRELPDVNPAAALPAGVLGPDDEFAYALPYGNAAPNAPTLAIWEDFQCPACAALEQINGQGIKELADDGQVQVFWRPTTFLDRNLNNTSSAEAVAAWGCAIDAGKAMEYSGVVYANQPSEGAGFTTSQLIDFGVQAGIGGSDLDTFTQCVNDGTYLGWAVNSTAVFNEQNVPGTPTGYLNGLPLNGGQLADQEELKRLVSEAAAAQ
jgi:protein-disulfide isomerase